MPAAACSMSLPVTGMRPWPLRAALRASRRPTMSARFLSEVRNAPPPSALPSISGSGRRSSSICRRQLRRGALDLRRHVHPEPGEGRHRIHPRGAQRREDRACQLDAGWFHRPSSEKCRRSTSHRWPASGRLLSGEPRRVFENCSLDMKSTAPCRPSPSGTSRPIIGLTFSATIMVPMNRAFAALDAEKAAALEAEFWIYWKGRIGIAAVPSLSPVSTLRL